VTAPITWDKGGEAVVVRVDGDGVVLRSTIPSPPGSRIEGVLAGEAPARVRVKVHSSKKVDEAPPAFVLEGRLLDATREVRERLVQLASSAWGSADAPPNPHPKVETKDSR
jgi:hypothetical protein